MNIALSLLFFLRSSPSENKIKDNTSAFMLRFRGLSKRLKETVGNLLPLHSCRIVNLNTKYNQQHYIWQNVHNFLTPYQMLIIYICCPSSLPLVLLLDRHGYAVISFSLIFVAHK